MSELPLISVPPFSSKPLDFQVNYDTEGGHDGEKKCFESDMNNDKASHAERFGGTVLSHAHHGGDQDGTSEP